MLLTFYGISLVSSGDIVLHGEIGTAVTQLILSLTVVGLIVTGIWWIVDAFLVHTWVKQHNAEVENRVIDRIFYDRGRSPEYPI
ncbi:hypothetical protein HMSSN139_52910 [Paenibacillus sp. HMSSN-139]|nr:hypothetical protein HMSSN139_52910 [Paenibacillus sp. HMSSN-139]